MHAETPPGRRRSRGLGQVTFDPNKMLVPVALGRRTTRAPIDATRVRELVKPFDGVSAGELAFGPCGVDSDGVPWIVVVAPTEKAARLQRQSDQITLIAWRWNTSPSCPFSLTLSGKERARPQPRWLRASDDPSVRALQAHKKLYVCVAHPAGAASGWFEARMVDCVGPGKFEPGQRAFDRLWTFVAPGLPGSRAGHRYDPLLDRMNKSENPIPLWSEPVSDTWKTLGAAASPWSDDLDERDHRTIAWARALHDKRALAAGLILCIRDRHVLDGLPSLMDGDGNWAATVRNAPILQALVDAHPTLRRWLVHIAGPAPDAQQAHEAALAMLQSPRAVFACVAQFVDMQRELDDGTFSEAIAASVQAALLDTRVTDRGRCRPWLENIGGGELALRTFRLAPTCAPDGLDQLWRHGLEISDVLDAGIWFGPTDLPAPLETVHEALEAVQLDSPVEVAHDRIMQLLAEAQSAQQWSVPWGARVDLRVGPFVALRIFEYRGEFSCHFLDEQDRYLHVALGLGQGTPKVGPLQLVRHLHDTGELVWNLEAAVTLQLVAAAVVRDFLVVEERDQVFSCGKPRTRQTGRHASDIVYLPRVRYNKILAHALEEPSSDGTGRARHSVGHHLRRAANVAPAQRFLALRYNVHLPEGFTFVRPHERGGEAEEARNKVYRSRSASRMLFEAVAMAPAGSRPAWFQFEKDCAQVLRGAGMQVIHRAANRNGDGGVDLYAHDATGDTWVIQCKCWAANRPVGVDVVRELVGAVASADRGATLASRGMIMTTSTFTSGAVSEAVALGYKLVDGAKFAALVTGAATI